MKRIWIVRKSCFLSSELPDFIYLLNYFSPTSLRKQLREAWSDLSSPLNMHPGSNLPLTVPGVFLAPIQLSRSTKLSQAERAPTVIIISQWEGREGGRKPVNHFHTPDNSFISAEIQEEIKEVPQSFQIHPPALYSPALSAHLEGKAVDPRSLESRVSLLPKQIGEDQVWSKQAACIAVHIEDTNGKGLFISCGWVYGEKIALLEGTGSNAPIKGNLGQHLS